MSNVIPTPLFPAIEYSFNFPDFQPFSARAGIGYQDLLENIRYYLERKLGPYVATLPTGLQNQLDGAIATITQAVDAALQAEDVRFAQTLAEIIAGSNTTLNDGTILAALQAANSTALAYLDARYEPKKTAFGFYLLSGQGIDLTGATDSSLAVNAFFAALNDGASVITPSNAVIMLSDSVHLNKRVHWSGSGEHRWTSGISNKPMIEVGADGCNFDGLYLTNPNHLAAQSGNKTAGLHITSNHVRVVNCRIVGQQQAIFVDAQGEYHDFVIMGNDITDVPGSGDGPSSTSNNGEDRGDGIYIMGAGATIVGNLVTALDGTDARIGIGLEALANLEAVPYVHGDSLFTITGNKVSGKFRRGIVNEGCKYTSISGNTVCDFTWWGIALIGTAWESIVADNAIASTRSSTDNQGSAWSPHRCGVMIGNNVTNSIVHHNVIAVEGNGQLHAGIVVEVFSGGTLSTDVVIESNTIDGSSALMMLHGIWALTGATRIKVRHNIIKGFANTGVWLSGDSTGCDVSHNGITGPGKGTGKGISTDNNPGNGGRFNFNHIENVGNALDTYFRTGVVQWIGNVVLHATKGLDFYGAVAPIMMQVNENTCSDVSTGYNNVPADNGNTIRVTNLANL